MTWLIEWFGGAGNAAFVATLLSICAIVVSVIAFNKSHKTQNSLVEIEAARERDRLIQMRKANLVAKIVRNDDGRSCLRVENKGRGHAYNMTMLLDRHEMKRDEAILPGTREIHELGPGGHYDYPLIIYDGMKRPINVDLTWQDDSGEAGLFRSPLTP